MSRLGVAILVWLVAAVSYGSDAALLTAPIGAEGSALLDSNLDIYLVVKPRAGDAWTRLSLRLTGDADNWKILSTTNGNSETLVQGRAVSVPLHMLKPDVQRKVISALFPEDRPTRQGGWTHKVRLGSGIEGEPLWKIAEWFTGDGANYMAIRSANSLRRLSTRKGDAIVIPPDVLSAPFRSTSQVLEAEDDPEPVEEPAKVEQVKSDAVIEAVADSLDKPSLQYNRTAERPYATYRLRKGEALYSSVAIRFTGRLYSKDVNEVVDELVKFNGIDDVSKLPVGYEVRIPMELLTADYRPSGDPKRVEKERVRRETAKIAKSRDEVKNLDGVYVVLDAGHGGRDVGTEHDGVWESTYVYDVACRLKKLLEEKSGAKVFLTTRSKAGGFAVQDRNVAKNFTDHFVLTTPSYSLEDPVIGVNLRWYLANSILRKALKQGLDEQKVVFLSLHADSLHPAVRGAMAYVPGQRYVQGTFTKSSPLYLARSEVRESPSVTHTEEDAILAEGLSTELAETMIDQFEKAGLAVHPYDPVRDNVVREGREWVPAVIRYNRIPTRLLLEICNLGNKEDRRLVQTRKYRQDVARAIYKSLVEFYEKGEGSGGKVPKLAAK